MSNAENLLIIYSVFLLSGSGFFLWPVCALLLRGKRRSSAPSWAFLAQLAGNLVLAGLALHANFKPDYRDWGSAFIILNFIFAPLAIGAAFYDFAYRVRWAHISPSEWRDTLDRLKHDYSKKLADPGLGDYRRAQLKRLLRAL
jgi:hypothetical protein